MLWPLAIWGDQFTSSYLLTKVPNKQVLLVHVLLPNLPGTLTDRDEGIFLIGWMSPFNLPRPSLASRGFPSRPEPTMNCTFLNDTGLSGRIAPSRSVQMLTVNFRAPANFAVQTFDGSLSFTITFFVSVRPLLFAQPGLRLTNCSLDTLCRPRLTPASSQRWSNWYTTSRDIVVTLAIECPVSFPPWNPFSFRMIVLRTSGRVFLTHTKKNSTVANGNQRLTLALYSAGGSFLDRLPPWIFSLPVAH